MRLRDTQVLLQMTSPSLRLHTQPVGDKLEVLSCDDLRSSVELLALVPSLEQVAFAALDHHVFVSRSHVISASDYKTLKEKIDALRAGGTTIQTYLEHVLPPAPSHYFGIRLPETNYTIVELQKTLSIVRQALDGPLSLLSYAPLKITSVDPGSIWLEVVAGGAIVLPFIGSLFKAAQGYFEYKKSKVELERVRAEAAKTQLASNASAVGTARPKVEEIAADRGQTASLLNTLEPVLNAAKQLQSAKIPLNPDETRRVLSESVEILASFSEAGWQVSLQLNATSEIARAFPANAVPDGLVRDLTTESQNIPRLRTRLPEADSHTKPSGR